MDIQTIQKLTLPILKKHRITKAALFGSITQPDKVDENSDIDLLVELPHDVHGFDYINLKVDLQQELTKALQKEVDLVEYSLVKPALQPYIMQSQIPIL